MRNRYLERLERQVRVCIKGSNINNYLKRVIVKKINIIRIIPVSYKEVHVILSLREYKRLVNLKSIYEISIIEYMGSKKIEENFKKNIILLLFMLMGLFIIIMLSKVIFSIDIIHQDREIRELLENELKRYGIVKYSFMKDYDSLESIEDKILEENKDRLEWIEIDSYGTKYIVRVEERKLNKDSDEEKFRSIVSKKDAVISRIEAIRGEKVKQVNEYVKKGDTIISGYITRPDNSKILTKAEGVVYGEVWYEVDIDYPICYQETNFTGRSKTVYALYFFDKRIGLFDFDDYRTFQYKRDVLISSNMLDIKFVREKQYEVIIKDEVYTEDIARVKAIDYVSDKIISSNSDVIEIRDVKILEEKIDGDSIEFKLFVRVIEDIGEVALIEDVPLEDKEE